MIRVQSFESDNLVPILSGLLNEEATSESYVFIGTLLKLLPPEEAVTETYLVLSTLEQLYSIFSHSRLIPSLNKDTILDTIQNNIYEELKENRYAGFRQYANTVCHMELDLLNEESIGTVADTLIEAISSLLDEAIDLGLSLQESISNLLVFQSNYKIAFLREAGLLMEMMSNSDMSRVRLHFWGWEYFLRRHKIYSVRDATMFLNLTADFLNVKDKWSLNQDSPLSSLDEIIQMEEEYIDNMTPLMQTPFEAFNQAIKFTKGEITVLAAPKGTGKTTFASMIAGIALAHDLRVQFYSPETPKKKMFNENILPAYIRAKYGFAVTTPQILGLEPPYEAGSEYSSDEKKVIIQMAKEELATSGNFFHIEQYYMYETMESDMRAHTKAFDPHFVFIDHTQEIRGEADHNRKTSRLATTVKSIAKDYGPHCFVLSHPGSQFLQAIPTLDEPISKNIKICAYSNDVETLADNIIGSISLNGQFKMFYTKLRSGTIPPMFTVFRMIKPQGWFEFRPEDQFTQGVKTEDAINALFEGRDVLMVDDGHTDEFSEEDI